MLVSLVSNEVFPSIILLIQWTIIEFVDQASYRVFSYHILPSFNSYLLKLPHEWVEYSFVFRVKLVII